MQENRFDLHILRSLRRIIRAVDIYSGKLKSQHQITGPQLICLLAIVEKGPLTATALAKSVHLSSSTMVGILDRLEKKELIHRTRDKKDRRQVNVVATESGMRLARNAPSPLQDGLARALSKLSDLEQATIALSLRRIVDLMEVNDFDAAPILETGQLDQNESPITAPDTSKHGDE
ncbi:MAG: MarR family transcriptional regulator [candidate division Zixibacteria bacterium]|nr:MarR family transcriptional regulator [candidate division Zixibacteria bacterium]MBU1470215.1 MarR family transcriptional regulator [candidate division Zixibacteria bacterium]MBU2626770.1 MarR family transcriptional regulator [candidate division Zixibacteria bacterium]